MAKPTREQYFWKRVDKNGPVPEHRPDLGPCWLWTGYVQHHGYGLMTSEQRGRNYMAHRWAYAHFVEPIPEGLHIDHLCRVRNCVRYSHLEAVTPLENRKRGLKYGHQNGLITHCPQGHEFTPENTRVAKNGNVQCIACVRRAQFNWRRAQGQAVRKVSTDEACANGHPWTPESLHIDRRGWRVCRICGRESRARSVARKRDAA